MAWTPVGGDVLFVEASRSPAVGRLTLTGQLGDVMKESARAALILGPRPTPTSWNSIRSSSRPDVHLHVPPGAIPKDGPSAGVTMVTALVSRSRTPRAQRRLHDRRDHPAGKVLPVGGIKEKVLAARRAGIKKVILRRRNERGREGRPQRGGFRRRLTTAS